MSKFLDCWEKVYGKGYKHRDGTPVLTAADKRVILSDIAERVQSGDNPVDAAVAAVGRQLSEAQAQFKSVMAQTGRDVSTPVNNISPSLPEPDEPSATTPATAPKPKTAEVFGRTGTAPVEASSQARARPVIQSTFFDSDQPVTPAATTDAFYIMRRYMDKTKGPLFAAEVRAAVDPLDANIANAVLRRELDDYSLKLLATGDKSLFELMQRYATTDFYIGTDAVTGKPITYRSIAQELAGNSRTPTSPSAGARDQVNGAKFDAASSVLGEENYTGIRDTVDNTGLTESDVDAVLDTPLPSGETLGGKVEGLVPEKVKRRRRNAEQAALAQDAAETEGEGEVDGEVPDSADAEPEVEVSPEDRTAERYIDRVDRSQVEVLTPDSEPNPVLRFIRQQELAGWRPKDSFTRSTRDGLVALGVTPDVALRTAERVWLRKEALRDSKARRKAASNSNTSSAERFIDAFDNKQTETNIPKKEDNDATRILKSAVGINRDVTQEQFKRDVASELMRTGVPRSIAVNAADRAWQAREIRVAKRRASMAEKAALKQSVTNAERLLDSLAKSQSDTPPAERQKQVDEIRAIYLKALKINSSDENLRNYLDAKFKALNVGGESHTPAAISMRDRLIKAIIRERTIRRAIQNSEAEVMRKAGLVANGETGSLAGLKKAILETPAAIQRQPAWRRKLMMDYFKQAGLTDAQTLTATKAFEKEFVKRLQDATDQAVTKFLKQKIPWAAKNTSPKGLQQRKVSKELEKLRKAVRLGLTDPTVVWDEEIARSHGWNGFTAAQHLRMVEIDRRLAQVTTPNNERARLIHELNKMITVAKQPPGIWKTMLATYVASALGGISTISVQGSAHVGGVMKATTLIGADPRDAIHVMKLFKQAMTTTLTETGFALDNDAYRNDILETLKGYEKPLQVQLDKGLKEFESKDPLTKAKGAARIVLGAQQYTMRLLSSLDQGFITASEEFTAAIFTKDILKRIGLSRQEANSVIEEALRQKAGLYMSLMAAYDAGAKISASKGGPKKGPMDRARAQMQANADATDIFMRLLYQAVADRKAPGDHVRTGIGGARIDYDPSSTEPFRLDGMTMEEWAQDIQRGARLDSEGVTGRMSEGVGHLDEGILRRVILAPLEGIAKAQKDSDTPLALAMRATYGFISIPIRTAGWYAGYSPYGYIRYMIHSAAVAHGKTSPYAQSYGTQSQVRQRLREATAGSIATMILAALATASADDDDDKKNAFFVTGGGPKDEMVREAWLRKFKPYSIVVKINGTYTAFNYGRLFEPVGWSAVIAGSIDDVALAKKSKEARGSKLDYLDSAIGNAIGNVVERSSFKSMVKYGELAGTARQPGSSKRIASQLAFSASSLLPWKSAAMSVQRIISDPVDNETISGSILATLPVAGPILGKPRINTLGDPVGDLTAGGRAFQLGIPGVPSVNTGGPAYDLILKHGRGPAAVRRNDFSKKYEKDDTDSNFYEYVRLRGQKIKAAMEETADTLKTVDTDTYAKFLKALSTKVNAEVETEMGLTRTTSSTSE